MASKPYLPDSDSGKAASLVNFAAKLPSHVVALGLTPAAVTLADQIRDIFAWALAAQQQAKTSSQQFTNFKNVLRDGPRGAELVVPTVPVLPVAPPLPEAGIFSTFADLVGTIKRAAGYTTAIGEDLGIIGDETSFNPNEGKPTLKLSIVNNDQVRVAWKKGNFQGVLIEVDRGAGSWTFLATDSVPDYIDTHDLPATPATWKYRAVYRFDDVSVGEWSDTTQITVGG